MIGLIVVVIALAATITLSIKNAANSLVEAYEKKYEIEATLEVNREAVMMEMQAGTSKMEDNIEKWNSISTPTVDEIKNYGASEYVDNYYYTVSLGMNAKAITPATDQIIKTTTTTKTTTKSFPSGIHPERPGGFTGKQSTTTKTTKQEEIKNIKGSDGDYTLVGYSSYSGMKEFVTGNYTINEGEISADFESVTCVISSELANLNSLNIGDTITFVNSSNSKLTYTLTITGIYIDNSDNANNMSKMYSYSANQIITNINVINKIINDDNDINTTVTPTFILKSKEVTSLFSAEVKEKGLSEYYEVTNNVEKIESETKAVTNVSSFATTFLIITLAIGGITLFVINMINVRERKYEIGVLRTIGMRKLSVIGQFVFELLVVSLISLLIGSGIGACFSIKVANKLLANEIEESKSEQVEIMGNFKNRNNDLEENGNDDKIEIDFNGVTNINEITDINAIVDFKVLLQLLGIGIGLSLISSISAMISIAKFSPLTILKERS